MEANHSLKISLKEFNKKCMNFNSKFMRTIIDLILHGLVAPCLEAYRLFKTIKLLENNLRKLEKIVRPFGD